jgi:hypothetical protein
MAVSVAIAGLFEHVRNGLAMRFAGVCAKAVELTAVFV